MMSPRFSRPPLTTVPRTLLVEQAKRPMISISQPQRESSAMIPKPRRFISPLGCICGVRAFQGMGPQMLARSPRGLLSSCVGLSP